MKIILINAVQERRNILAPGTELEKDDAEAQSMIARGVARAVPSETSVAAEPPAGGASDAGAADGASEQTSGDDAPVVLTEADKKLFLSFGRDVALEWLESIPAAEKQFLQGVLELEQANKKRATVLDALGRKLFPPVQD